MAEGYVDPVCGGTPYRVVTVDVLQPDGTVKTVAMQVVTIRDSQGNEIPSDRDVLLAILNRLDVLCAMYGQATQQNVLGLTARPLA